jgi:PPP family 3-phenylpropionic acid transporter
MRDRGPVALSLFYLTNFGALGVYLPYFNLYLKDIGFGGLQIGIVSALLPLSTALVPPFGALCTDRLGHRRALVVLSSLLALALFALLPGARGFAAVAWIVAAYAAARAPALPLVEATAMEIAEAGGPAYGRMRLWGSIAFIALVLGTGPLVARRGEAIVLPIILALLALNVLAALLLPGDRRRAHPRGPAGGLTRLLRQPSILMFLLACLLMQASHGPYYVFYSIHLARVGYRPAAIGALWGLAVACEVFAMLRMPSVLARFGPLPTMAGAFACAFGRWLICAASAAPVAMVLAQMLHAATYAAFHVAAVSYVHRRFGADLRASAQAIYGSVTYGAGNIAGMVLSGLWFERLGAQALFARAAWAALAGGLLVIAAARRERRGGGL